MTDLTKERRRLTDAELARHLELLPERHILTITEIGSSDLRSLIEEVHELRAAFGDPWCGDCGTMHGCVTHPDRIPGLYPHDMPGYDPKAKRPERTAEENAAILRVFAPRGGT